MTFEGSGKSTVVQTLFRLLEAEKGRIVIDGIDISQIGLHALRTKISVIPQIPTLFSGCTVRENLDLFALHSDEKVRQVLLDCHMLDVVDELPNGWQTIVAEGGTNFSVGQRQLLCLARSILSDNRILIMDESTANVDRRTDQLLQEALQKSFQSGTIIAVAHRLDTIIDFDLCLVLGGGRVLEYGSPAHLIRSNGHFASMVNDTGDVMSEDLRNRAYQKESRDQATAS
jgi:ATP-binding cassette, subfamily C (CFTR/MRP), member 4